MAKQDKSKTALGATLKARRILVEKHQAEYAEILKAERISLGLPPEKTTGKLTIQDKINRVKAKLEALEAEAKQQNQG